MVMAGSLECVQVWSVKPQTCLRSGWSLIIFAVKLPLKASVSEDAEDLVDMNIQLDLDRQGGLAEIK